MDSVKWCRGARNENAELVDKSIRGIEGAVVRKGISRGRSRVEQSRRDALVDGIFGYVNEEERKHVGKEK